MVWLVRFSQSLLKSVMEWNRGAFWPLYSSTSSSHACWLMQSKIWRVGCLSDIVWMVLCLIFVASLPKQSPSLTSTRKPSSLMTVHLWRLIASLNQQSSLVSQLALRKLKFCTSLHQVASTQSANVESFKYLGSITRRHLDREADARIGKARQTLGRLRSRVLNHHNVRLSTKLKVYNTVVIPSLMYGFESCTLYRTHIIRSWKTSTCAPFGLK